MTWTIERKMTISGIAGALVLAVGGIGAWHDVKNKAASAAEATNEIRRDLNDHEKDHDSLNKVVRDLSLGQAVLREQVHGLKEDLQDLKSEQRRDFERVLRALGNHPLSETPFDRP